MKLYKKLHLDYDKRLEALEKEKAAEEKLLTATKGKLKEKDDEIDKIQ
mgnify:CR=1 FL=1